MSQRPYELHTGQELTLMLSGTKPLAAFLFPVGEDENISLNGQPFQRYVTSGQLIRSDVEYTFRGAALHRVLFGLPDEEWRFKAYDLMCQLFEKDGWNDTLERMEGMLLGYEEWQNDWHMANRDHYQLYGN